MSRLREKTIYSFKQSSPLIFIRLYVCQHTFTTRHYCLTLGSTVEINWLPVLESARSTIMALRPLNKRISSTKLTVNRSMSNSPWWCFPHSVYEPVKCLFGTFFESFHNRFDSLFVCGKFEKARQKMSESQLLVLRRAMFENCRWKSARDQTLNILRASIYCVECNTIPIDSWRLRQKR